MTDKKSHWLIRGVKRKQLRKERRKALRQADKELKKLGIEIRDTDYTSYDFCGSICPVCEEIINRQKAEIERLTNLNFELSEKGEAVCIAYKTAKIEAIKEFAEKLKDAPIVYDIPLFGLSTKNEIIDYCNNIMSQVRDAIDSLVEEMVGAE